MAASSSQHVLAPEADDTNAWTLKLDAQWDVLGPFPIHAREQHFLSPAFPLRHEELTPRFVRDDNATWPSAYADGASVRWSSATQDDKGHLSVSFPNIRHAPTSPWSDLRSTEGWAALQHHALLHTTLTISPPSHPSRDTRPQSLLVNAVQTSFFALLPRGVHTPTPQWHAGNIYAFPHAPTQLLPLPPLDIHEETVFDVYLSGDYEIRLFGDPLVQGRVVPSIEIDFTVAFDKRVGASIVRESQLDVVPDFVDGYALGDALSLGVRNADTQKAVDVVDVSAEGSSITATLLKSPTRIASRQTRLLTVKLAQSAAFKGDRLVLSFGLSTGETLRVELPLTQRDFATYFKPEEELPILSLAHLVAGSAVQTLVVPPREKSDALPILFLHGAGVEIDNPELPRFLPRQSHSWILYPSGRTSWGFDWHGPSTAHALTVTPALARALSRIPLPSLRFAEDTRIVLAGHSNGGQGAWHVASRYPDRVAALIPAAGYVKSQAYVPWTLARGPHYADPALSAVFAATMLGDDNDLFVGNLVGRDVLALHGGADENVPVQHGRTLVATLSTWNASRVSFVEMPGKPHWFPGYFASAPEVQPFLDAAVHLPAAVDFAAPRKWTLTVAWPHESGSMFGFRILDVQMPGRLARLDVEAVGEDALRVRTNNVYQFAFPAPGKHKTLIVDGTMIDVASAASGNTGLATLCRQEDGVWKFDAAKSSAGPFSPGPVAHALDTPSTIRIVVPDAGGHTHSAALRLAHNLLVYLALDAEILTASDAERLDLSDGSTVIVLSAGPTEVATVPHLDADSPIALDLKNGLILLDGYALNEPSTGVLGALASESDGQAV
ncbi:hypothetical protein AURDEDRAFT_149076 [Auricularia subglabra TFB-10046 SS5]|nr:hypothetical protein AURDEDRAFT_149076 [Auricularia subglabra TFB-10046 SS5]